MAKPEIHRLPGWDLLYEGVKYVRLGRLADQSERNEVTTTREHTSIEDLRAENERLRTELHRVTQRLGAEHEKLTRYQAAWTHLTVVTDRARADLPDPAKSDGWSEFWKRCG